APPSGQDPFGGPGSLIPGCLTHAVTGGMAAETEEVLAAGSTLSSDITEAVAVGQAPRVTASEATLASEMDRCARKPPPGGVAGKIEAVVMATVGQRSGAWQQKVQTGPSDLSLLVVAARQGDVLLLMAFGDEGTPNVAADRSLAASSLRDLAPLAG
ncbi:MAG TPA: hypothetical protein VKV25_09020, partial [Acidimicrobiales bacterium]|nr:hypothetical protein [Acidimicrobiales bacterium]